MTLYDPIPADDADSVSSLTALRRRIFFRTVAVLTVLVVVGTVVGLFAGRHWVRQALKGSLPQLDGSVAIPGLSVAVSVQRDAHGVPHIRAASLDDLLMAQGYVTAQDRLWQMDALRRHAAGSLAEVLGASLVAHDRLQRTLQLRASADRALATLPPEQLHLLEQYAEGVNASMEAQRSHLPLEFRILRYEPSPWTPRDSILVGLVMFQDLTNSFSMELSREALTARLPAHLIADLYPVETWRDHPPAQPVVDLTAPQTDIPDVPLDESQSRLARPVAPVGETASPGDLAALEETLKNPVCDGCFSGSNDWVVSGAHTATGKPLLSNDMHLAHGVPGIWYQADLEASTLTGGLHVTGVSLPGVPFVIVGHNEHVAWGFTNLGATVQDVYIEHMRGAGSSAEYQAADGGWRPVLHQQETIHVKGGKDVVLDVQATQHGAAVTPVLTGILPSEKRTLSLRWTIYDPANVTPSFLAMDSAVDGSSLVNAFSTFGGPAQNLVYADDQGHIGYHAVGRIPIRGSVAAPAAISPVPSDALDTTQEWVANIPYDKLPQAVDPPNGILATANARVTADDYPYPITLDWSAPYRNERIWKLLSERSIATKDHLTPSDMLAIQTDVYSDLDHVIAERLAYAIDHASKPDFTHDKRLHQAADLLRDWNGSMDTDAAAPTIVSAARTALWPLLLDPQALPQPGQSQAEHASDTKPEDLAALYTWSNKAYAEEWLIMHTPARWLSSRYSNWDDLLTAAVARGLVEGHAPHDLSTWRYGHIHTVDIEHPIYGQSALLQRLIGVPIGTGDQPQSGDGTTIKQVGHTFGPSERFTADFANFDDSTLNLVLGESSNPASPWFLDQWHAWYHGTTFSLPFSHAAVDAATTHTLTLTPR
ncbi:penicillin acylase family protein [Granulicella sp. L60]|uniref:penicillin acylase family protein n=1 Tax=Granulicella sp. L60 TaxID=1641866 RepID=UPI00131AE2FB|nr:penicillin acylase family protein [Granulicella sp. L60]